MIQRSLLTGFVFLCGVASAAAQSCVSPTFDTPLEGAVDVVTRHVDVPSVRFPNLWQEGVLNEYFYAIYADGEGVVKSSASAREWKIDITCQPDQPDCAFTTEGAPPQEATGVASVIAACLKGEWPPEPEPEPEPEPVEVEQVEAEAPQPQAEPLAPCGLATLGDESEGRLLQQLLIIAGADPGPIDGFVGNDTRTALREVLGVSSVTLGTGDAITALDKLLCE